MFRFNLPTTWIHGNDSSSEIVKILDELKCDSPLIITDSRLTKIERFISIIQLLKENNVKFRIFSEVDKEPTVSEFTKMVDRIDLKKYDSFIAIGGGSVIDTAKGLRIISSYGGKITDYAGFGKIPGKINIPLIAIPTTAGTGSEVSDGAVFTDEKRKTKFAVGGNANFPTFAITDPKMTLSMPPMVTATTGIDALVHAIESYISKFSNNVTELFAVEAIRRIGNNIALAVKDGNNLEAREQMQTGATLAMISTANAKLGFCHAIAMPLCALYNLPHGIACGIVLPEVLRFNEAAVGNKVRKIAKLLNLISNDEEFDLGTFVEQINNLINDLGLKTSLLDYGYVESDIKIIEEGTLQSFQSSNNPRTMTPDGIYQVVKSIL